MTAEAVHALIVFAGNDRLDQRVDTTRVVLRIVFYPFTIQRFHVQRLTALFGGIPSTVHGIQLIAADHPNIQYVLGSHHLLAQNITVINGARHHHGVQAIEKGLCQAIHVFVAVLFEVGSLGLGAVNNRKHENDGESRCQCCQQQKTD